MKTREERAAYNKARNAKPEVRAAARAYDNSRYATLTEVKISKKAFAKARSVTPECKAYHKAIASSPEGKAYQKEQNATPENKAATAAWRLTEEGIASCKASALKKRCKRVGITAEYYDSLPKKCSIRRCTATEAGGNGDWHMDHDKVARIFRGLLCNKHNRKVSDNTLDDIEDIEEYLLLAKCKIQARANE